MISTIKKYSLLLIRLDSVEPPSLTREGLDKSQFIKIIVRFFVGASIARPFAENKINDDGRAMLAPTTQSGIQ